MHRPDPSASDLADPTRCGRPGLVGKTARAPGRFDCVADQVGGRRRAGALIGVPGTVSTARARRAWKRTRELERFGVRAAHRGHDLGRAAEPGAEGWPGARGTGTRARCAPRNKRGGYHHGGGWATVRRGGWRAAIEEWRRVVERAAATRGSPRYAGARSVPGRISPARASHMTAKDELRPAGHLTPGDLCEGLTACRPDRRPRRAEALQARPSRRQ